MSTRPRCEHCGEAIGSYEAIVIFSGGVARVTSFVTDPDLMRPALEGYHRECYEDHVRIAAPLSGRPGGRDSEAVSAGTVGDP